jgi:diaminopimelate decarboxylase
VHWLSSQVCIPSDDIPTVARLQSFVAPASAGGSVTTTGVSAERDVGPRTWWVRSGLEIVDGRLHIAGRDAEALARQHGTPLYVYDVGVVRANVLALQSGFARAGLTGRVRYALKANRESGILRFLRGLGVPGAPESVGIDACSPGEVLYAMENGWEPAEISFTGTNVSERDLDVLLSQPVLINVDLLSQLDRIGRRAPGSSIGLRLNPRGGAGWGGEGATLYSGAKPGKFGVYEENLDDALEIARLHDLSIVRAHVHVGDGFLTRGLGKFEGAIERLAAMVRRLVDAGCPIEEINTGGGLGVPLQDGDEPLDVDAYAEVLARHLGSFGVTIACEPGDFIVKQSGTLLAEVVTVEDRLGTTFVGLDVGWNVVSDHFVYKMPIEQVLCRAADAPRTERVTISGHINEGNDLFADDYPFPPVKESDVVAMMSVGGYNQSMAMPHCLRPVPPAIVLPDDE